jgi:predicted ATP-grasp superfamily ATP-dependent carboligase
LRIFVSEFVCGGGWLENAAAGSLAVEGRALLSAIVDDFSRIDGVEVDTTWDARLGPPPFRGARTFCVESPEQEMQTFRRLAEHCDATLVIAPEFRGILSKRCRIVEDVGGRLSGPSSRAVALCSDKLQLAGHLFDAGVETISTRLVEWDRVLSPSAGGERPRFPIVVKPRDGAGSQNTFLVNDADELVRLGRELVSGAVIASAAPHALRKDSGRPTQSGRAKVQPLTIDEYIEQPFIAGNAVSVALVIAPSRRNIETFVPARQCLSDDGRFRYLGGKIPLDQVNHDAIQRAAVSACSSIPGLRTRPARGRRN